MKAEAQRIAIAKACGIADHVGLKKRGYWWRPEGKGYTDRESEAGHYTREEAATLAHGGPEPVTIHELMPPYYLTDLNAMHEAEKTLTKTQRARWAEYLWRAVGLYETALQLGRIYEDDLAIIAHSTAAQRAEAFLRCLNLWTEDET